jgi:hypothetical protein
MGMLGLIHRTVLGRGPKQFAEFFKPAEASRHPMGRENVRRHNRQVESHRTGKFLDIVGHSVLGLIDVYNLLPSGIVAAETVSVSQTRLQKQLVEAAKGDQPHWREMFSPRASMHNHPLRSGALPIEHFARTSINEEGGSNASCVQRWLQFGQ